MEDNHQDLLNKINQLELKIVQLKLEKLEQEQEQSKNFLFTTGFPNVIVKYGTTNSYNNDHLSIQPECITQGNFVCLNENEMKSIKTPRLSSLWIKTNVYPFTTTGTLQKCSTQRDVQMYVNDALIDIINNCSLSKEIEFHDELSIFDSRSDIRCVRNKQGIPIGIVIIKKPNRPCKLNAVDAPPVYGQIFDYMLRLREYYGLRYVFGIITTMQHWRICWLPDTTTLANSNNSHIQQDELQPDPEIATKRKLVISQLYECNNADLVNALISVMHKMHHSPINSSKSLISFDRYYMRINKCSWCWSKLNESRFVFNYKMPASSDEENNYFLIQDYGDGADGRVWLGASNAGNLAIIKFSKFQEGDASGINDKKLRLEEENNAWNSIWKQQTRVITLHNQPALLMPFAFHCKYYNKQTKKIIFNGPDHREPTLFYFNSSNEAKPEHIVLFENQITQAESNPRIIVEQAISTMIEQGYEHQDLHWRHVALLPNVDDGTLKPILIDLSRVECITPEIEKNRVLQRCMDQFN